MVTTDVDLSRALDPATWTIADVASETGVSIDALRYYERVGMIPPVARSSGGQRLYGPDDVGWVVFVRRLRATGMSVQQIAGYTAMVRSGDGTIVERRRLLENHRRTVVAALDELRTALDTLDRKIAHYEAAEQGIDLDCSEAPLTNTARLG